MSENDRTLEEAQRLLRQLDSDLEELAERAKETDAADTRAFSKLATEKASLEMQRAVAAEGLREAEGRLAAAREASERARLDAEAEARRARFEALNYQADEQAKQIEAAVQAARMKLRDLVLAHRATLDELNELASGAGGQQVESRWALPGWSLDPDRRRPWRLDAPPRFVPTTGNFEGALAELERAADAKAAAREWEEFAKNPPPTSGHAINLAAEKRHLESIDAKLRDDARREAQRKEDAIHRRLTLAELDAVMAEEALRANLRAAKEKAENLHTFGPNPSNPGDFTPRVG